MIHVVVVLGTRPEAIKMAPLILALRRARTHVRTTVVLSGQHAHLVMPILDFFSIDRDISIRLMRPNQTLAGLTSRALGKIDSTLADLRPDWVVVQGDTTTAMACALAAFYRKIKVAHLEAGLRTGNIYSPFPEEINRRIISQIASLHWAPTQNAARSLRRESLPLSPGRVIVTGNTVIDALQLGIARVRRAPRADAACRSVAGHKRGGRRRLFVLVTGHRRESFGAPLRAICKALRACARSDRETLFVYPVHPNPNILGPVKKMLGGEPNILLTGPKNYPEFIQLLDCCDIIVTDSGGVQEEAPSLGKTVLVTRETTERPEGLRTGLVKLVGHDPKRLTGALRAALAVRRRKTVRHTPVFPYGDGHAAARCVASLLGRPLKPFEA
jgi:UDP-N-acetylglucosamine 2-epimerase (non-hydrolysing)